MSLVLIRQCASYEYPALRSAVFDILDRLDGNRIKQGTSVLIKPNLLTAAPPEAAITTHPLVVRATAEYALGKGARVRVSDSNAMSSFAKVVEVTGLRTALKGLPVELFELKEPRRVATGGTFGTIELARDSLGADVVVNLPKLKTHSQMGLTLAVKNLFGCVVGTGKPEWHFRVGENKELFAELLVHIYKAVRPAINLMDGILAMEGDGPGMGGTPRTLGVLMGSKDAVALDMAACRILGVEPSWLPTNRAAARMGLSAEPEISGPMPEIKGFKIPDTRELLFGPSFARGFLRRHIATRPSAVEALCRDCGECARVCPAGAIEAAQGGPRFDYEKCIRCYCCLEVCPAGAMRKRHSWLRRVVERLVG
jgi:uncharacterized protein (DUF362 family)/Pyruvate/2-oxoacid:ferredoxin oxidoreductase delta subunit